MKINGKTRDNLNAVLDLIEELKPRKIGRCTYLPLTCYTLSEHEKLSYYQCLKSMKVP